MRALSKLEKDILNKIIDYYQIGVLSNLASVLDPQLGNKSIYLDFAHNNAEIRADASVYGGLAIVDAVREATTTIVTTVNLLKYLQDNGYVILFNEADLPSEIEYGPRLRTNPVVYSTIRDNTVKELLLDYSLKTILVGQPLVDYVKNDFRTAEEVRSEADSKTNKNNLRIAVWALCIATALSFVEIYLGSQEVKYAKLQLDQEQNVKVNEEQIKSIKKDLNDIETKIDTTSSRFDSLLKKEGPTSPEIEKIKDKKLVTITIQ